MYLVWTATKDTVQGFCVPVQRFLQVNLTIKHTGLDTNTANSVLNPGSALPFRGSQRSLFKAFTFISE